MRKEGQNAPRKAYAKPCIAIEDFTLNQFIASCTINVNETGWTTELLEFSEVHYNATMRGDAFGYGLVCDMVANPNDYNAGGDTVCYHSSASPLFTS